MRPLAFFERLLERAFERPSARLFRTPLRVPVIERRIERAMELERRRVGRRTVVPDRFVVAVRPGDLTGPAAEAGGGEALAGRLADASLSFARAHGYTMDRLPVVTLAPDPTAPAGDVRVAASFSTGSGVVGVGEGPSRVVVGAGTRPGATGAPTRHPTIGPGRTDPTLVFQAPRPPAVHATLLVREPGGRWRTVEISDAPLVVGRDPGCDLVLDDRRVSRQHVRIAPRGGFLVLADLGSTNGTYLRDERVAEVALGLGDVVTLGDSTIEIRPAGEGPGSPSSPRDSAAAGTRDR
jgi:hypothetical protein